MIDLLPARFVTVFVLSALLLSGCCANNVCDCKDTQADIVRLRFSSAFTVSDLDTIVIRRYPLPYKPGVKAAYDSVTIIQPAAQVPDSIYLTLNNNTPFAADGTHKLNHYRYVVQLRIQPPHSKPVAPVTAITIDSVGLRGSFEGTGCCTCYTNSVKTAIFSRGKAGVRDSTVDLKRAPYVLKVIK